MDTFAEVREHILEYYDPLIDEPFVLGFDFKLNDSGRRQSIFLAEITGNDERRYLRIETPVVPLSELDAEKCLRINLTQRVGYLAVGDMDNEPWIKLCHNIPYALLSAQELDHTVARMASKADRFEQWLHPESDIA